MVSRAWPDVLPEAETVVLEQVQLLVRKLLSEEQLHLSHDAVHAYEVAQHLGRAMVYELRSTVLQHKCDDFEATAQGTMTMVVPATWWQHWKLDHAGSRLFGWVSSRWPVRTTEITSRPTVTATFSKSALFPQPAFDYPKELGPVLLHITPSLRERVTFTHELSEYDPVRLNREYRDYRLFQEATVHVIKTGRDLTFEQWRERRAQRVDAERDLARHEHDHWYGV